MARWRAACSSALRPEVLGAAGGAGRGSKIRFAAEEGAAEKSKPQDWLQQGAAPKGEGGTNAADANLLVPEAEAAKGNPKPKDCTDEDMQVALAEHT